MTLRVHESPGVCSEGLCEYVAFDEGCEFGCADGRCNDDPCAGVVCNAPPADTCDDATTLRTYAASGTCTGGDCSYTATTIECELGCSDGQCNGDPCAGVTCDSPPADTCLDADTLLAYDSAGTCDSGDGGTCSYATSETTCEFGCSDGACNPNPCAGVTCDAPPADTCVDANTLLSYDSPGTCDGGSCSYTTFDTTCEFGCSAGACNPDPCAGVTCDSPPADTCVDADTLLSYDSPGTCDGGACSYTSSQSTCEFGCSAGACNPDPCAGVTCDSPPADTCIDADTLLSYDSPGTCDGGTCSYTSSQSTCEFGCSAGACNPDPCAGVTCDAPPASQCIDLTTLQSYENPGVCTDGVCSYAPLTITCPGYCADDECVDPDDTRPIVVVHPPTGQALPDFVPDRLSDTTYGYVDRVTYDNHSYHIYRDEFAGARVVTKPLGSPVRLAPGNYVVVLNDTFERITVDFFDVVEISAGRIEVPTEYIGYYTVTPPERFDYYSRPLALRGCGTFGNQVRSRFIFGGCDGEIGGGDITLSSGVNVLPATYQVNAYTTYLSPGSAFMAVDPGQTTTYTPTDISAHIVVNPPPGATLPDWDGSARYKYNDGMYLYYNNDRFYVLRYTSVVVGFERITSGTLGTAAKVPAGHYHVVLNDTRRVVDVAAGTTLVLDASRAEVTGNGYFDLATVPPEVPLHFAADTQCNGTRPWHYTLFGVCWMEETAQFDRGYGVNVFPGSYDILRYNTDGVHIGTTRVDL